MCSSDLATEKSLAGTVREALRSSVMVERFEKTQVDVYATVLDARGGEAVACVLAATCALARAGVECRDVVTACEAARIGDRIVLDPDENEVAASDGKVFLAQMSSLDFLRIYFMFSTLLMFIGIKIYSPDKIVE